MARLEKNEYASMQASQLKDPIIFVVDMVNGFVNEGALHDEGIDGISPSIERILKGLDCRNMFVCDNHPPHTREFQAFPAHCVIGTSEAKVIDSLQPYIKRTIAKNSTNTFMAPEFQEFLQDELSWYKDIIITGCCTYLCILQFVLSFQSWLNEHNKEEHRLIVPVDCVDTYDNKMHPATMWNAYSLTNMAMNGIDVVSTITSTDW